MVLSMADNLSAALQGSTVSASEGQSLMHLILTTLQNIHTDDSFGLFWKATRKKQQECGVDDPVQPRQWKVPRRYEVGSTAPHAHVVSVEDFYRHIYFDFLFFVFLIFTSTDIFTLLSLSSLHSLLYFSITALLRLSHLTRTLV